ncbi:unnamed protein product [Pieris macdunnoughi]|uniref:Uncharacterized protein n=1 Tax=Pieris macdunnoughi TaxID=345717 RepID=A0A821LQK0_9NEOP|nr:unnamed protein product [Pieris macdunnoughi]
MSFANLFRHFSTSTREILISTAGIEGAPSAVIHIAMIVANNNDCTISLICRKNSDGKNTQRCGNPEFMGRNTTVENDSDVPFGLKSRDLFAQVVYSGVVH